MNKIFSTVAIIATAATAALLVKKYMDKKLEGHAGYEECTKKIRTSTESLISEVKTAAKDLCRELKKCAEQRKALEEPDGVKPVFNSSIVSDTCSDEAPDLLESEGEAVPTMKDICEEQEAEFIPLQEEPVVKESAPVEDNQEDSSELLNWWFDTSPKQQSKNNHEPEEDERIFDELDELRDGEDE